MIVILDELGLVLLKLLKKISYALDDFCFFLGGCGYKILIDLFSSCLAPTQTPSHPSITQPLQSLESKLRAIGFIQLPSSASFCWKLWESFCYWRGESVRWTTRARDAEKAVDSIKGFFEAIAADRRDKHRWTGNSSRRWSSRGDSSRRWSFGDGRGKAEPSEWEVAFGKLLGGTFLKHCRGSLYSKTNRL